MENTIEIKIEFKPNKKSHLDIIVAVQKALQSLKAEDALSYYAVLVPSEDSLQLVEWQVLHQEGEAEP